MEHYNNSVYKKIKNKEIDEILGDIIEEDINNIMNKEQKIELIVNKNDKIKTQNLKLYITIKYIFFKSLMAFPII